MESVKLGQLIEGTGNRDAIHVAVAPVVAAEDLRPGQDVGFVIDGDTQSVGACRTPIGIVDPFLKMSVRKGQAFYLCLYPQSITSLRHDWAHPAFPAQVPLVASSPATDSEIWLRAYAMRMNSYDTPQEAFDRLIEGIKCRELFAHGSDLHGLYELHDAEDLRFHAERFLGIKIEWGDFQFSCSC